MGKLSFFAVFVVQGCEAEEIGLIASASASVVPV